MDFIANILTNKSISISFSFPMASLVTECVCVCLLFLSNSTLFLITEHRGEGEAVELILWEEEENLKEQSRSKWKLNETTENMAVVGGAGRENSGLM